jgi:hypothetical protein
VPDELLVYPNCYLYAQNGLCADARIALFLFATPLVDIAARSDLLATAAAIRCNAEPWQPQAVDTENTDFAVYHTLVLRIRLLDALCRQLSSPLYGSDASHRRATQMAYAWLDAHLLMALAIDALAYVPTDASSEMQLLLQRYAPTHYTALRECDMPELTTELERCNLFVGGVAAHKEDPFTDLFSKALPREYETKDLVTKVADSAVRHAGFFAFLKLLLAATQLGLYEQSTVKAPFPVRYAVYRLFFFELDLSLRPSSRATPIAGTAAAVRAQFDMCSLVPSLARVYTARASDIDVHYLSYAQSVAHTYSAAMTPRRPKVAESTKGVMHRSRKKTLHVAIASRSAQRPPAVDSEALRQRVLAAASGAQQAATAEAVTDGASLLARTSLRFDNVTQADNYCSGLYVANAIARLAYRRNCGIDVYEQRRSNAQLDADETQPVAQFTPIEYTSAAKALLPRDHVLMSEERQQCDALIYEWLTTNATLYAPTASKAKRKRKKSEFVFQDTMLLAVRDYIVFALRRWCEPLRRAFERLVPWGEWETKLITASDQLRRHIGTNSTVTGTWSAAQLLCNAEPYAQISLYMPMNQFRAHRAPFLHALLHRFSLKSRGYSVKTRTEHCDPYDLQPVDHVLPRETELLLRYSLNFWCYPRTLACATELPLADFTIDGDGQRQPLDFVIEPVFVDPAVALDEASIRSKLVQPARYPLSLFHASRAAIERFGWHRNAYLRAPTDEQAETAVRHYVEWLASRSAYQYQLMFAFCRAVDRHMHVRSFPLPRHIVEHQMTTLRNQNCMPADAVVPPHLLRALVCVGCARVATFLPPAEQRQSTMAFGNDEVRIWTTPSDDEEIFAGVRARSGRPLKLEQLAGAESWLKVLLYRTRNAPFVYDRYCRTESREPSEAELQRPETVGMLPLNATEDDFVARVARIFSTDPPTEAAPVDRRSALVRECELEPPHMVARGRGRLGEMIFTDALWEQVSERVGVFGGTASGEKSFLLMGHALPQTDAKFAPMRFACKTRSVRSETKKSKHTAQKIESKDAALDIGAMATDNDNEQDAVDNESLVSNARFATKQCRDAHANNIYTCCGRELMREIEYLGRALYYTGLDASKRIAFDETDFIAICCDCLAATRSRDLRAIADRIVCTACYNSSRVCNGSVALRVARGESTKTAATAVPSALTSDSSEVIRGAKRQTLFSASYAVLCSEVIADGTVCAVDRCKTVKSSETSFYGLEVLYDTSIGNETFGFIYYCATHARLYRPLFSSATRLPLSTVRYFMADSKRFANNVGMHGDFLESIMRGDARATDNQVQREITKKIETRKRTVVQQRRKQRKIAITSGDRDAERQERATVDRLLDAPHQDADDVE